MDVQGIRGKLQKEVKLVEEMVLDIVILTETKKKSYVSREIVKYLHLYGGVKIKKNELQRESKRSILPF